MSPSGNDHELFMTPAVRVLKTADIAYALHRYEHTDAHSDYGIDASKQLGVPPQQVFKTLVVALDRHELVVAIGPVSARLHMKSLATAAGARKAFMAEAKVVERTTGYVLGGVSPLGQKKTLRTFIDTTAQDFDTIFVSGGRRGLEIELAPSDLCELADGCFADIAAG